MALKVVSMEELRLQVLLEPERTGESVSEVCARRGISRASFYRYRRRFLTEGAEGLEPRTRRPRSSPARITASLEVEICTLRCRHPRWGARRIRAELRRAGLDAPAISTVHQTLRRNNLVAPQPRRRQRADKRFERETSNDLWQIDATQVVLRGGEEAWVLDCLDDHARFCLHALACESPTGEAAWACFSAAAATYGLPTPAPLRQPPELYRAPLRARGRLRAKTRRGRRRPDQRRPRPPADPGQARALPPHPQGVAGR